jgi:hypothetical protein
MNGSWSLQNALTAAGVPYESMIVEDMSHSPGALRNALLSDLRSIFPVHGESTRRARTRAFDAYACVGGRACCAVVRRAATGVCAVRAHAAAKRVASSRRQHG